jgi:hypothetical protein
MVSMLDPLRYRLLQEWRSALRNGARSRLKAALFVVAPALALVTVGSYHAMLIGAAGPWLNAGTACREGVLAAAFLASGALVFLVSCAEIMQQVWFARDQELLATAPINRDAHIAYRWFFAVLRSAPWAAVFLSLPVLAASALPSAGIGSVVWAIALSAIFWAWLALAALCTAALVVAAANRGRLERHACFVILYLLQIGAVVLIISYRLTPSAWLSFAGNCESRGMAALLPHHQLASIMVMAPMPEIPAFALRAVLLIGTLVSTSLACRFVILRIWPWADLPAATLERDSRASRIHGCRSTFSTSRSWAIFQKDLRDLIRNPVYRNCLLANYLLLVIGLWAQARQASSGRLLMTTLPLMCLTPLIVSARTVSQEYPLLELYRLALPCGYNLLDAKLFTQGVVSTILALAASLPFFLLLRPGLQPSTVLLFTGASLLYVPVLTALALALGTFFPELSVTPGLLGLKLKGFLLYCLVAVPLYAFLLDRMYLGTALYSMFLLPAIALLYAGARRRLETLLERRIL